MIIKQFFKFLCLLLLPTSIIAQSPGGVSSGLKLWYDAGKNASLTQWTDKASNFTIIKQGTGAITLSPGDATVNFNPYYNFSNSTLAEHFSGVLSGSLVPSSLGRLNTSFGVGIKSANIDAIYNHIFRFGSIAGAGSLHRFGVGMNGANHQATLHYINSGGIIDRSHTTNLSLNSLHILSGQISSVISGSNRQVGLNGNYQTFSDAITADVYDNFQIGGSLYGFAGKIPEVIYYNVSLSNTDKQKVNSYLGIKYGTTLSHNYLASSGSTVWNIITNSSFNNNIVGIARDDNSGLHQKQSTSTNPSQKLVIGAGTGLFNTNILNTNTLSNNQFLIIGDNGLEQKLSTVLSFMAPGGEVNNRFNSIWRVQNTNSVGTIMVAWPTGIKNLHLVRSTDATINSSDEFVAMTGTATINGISYNTAQITFNDGDYFTFAGYQSAPGGVVTGLQLWYDAGVTANLTNWKDRTNDFMIVKQGAGALTLSNGDATVNFNPYYTFNNSTLDAHFSGVLSGSLAPSLLGRLNTSFGVGIKSANIDAIYNHIFRFGSIAGAGSLHRFGVGMNGANHQATLHYINSGGIIDRSHTTNLSLNSLHILSGQISSVISGSNRQVGLNGNYQTFSDAITADVYDNFQIGGSLYGFAGKIPEVIYYNVSLSNTDKQKVNSYLGIKYGTTLSHNYLASSGSTVWNIITNSSFNNNILGIARDDNSGLYQKQSISTNPSQKLIIGAGTGLTNTNVLNTNTLNNNQFLILGDNGLGQVLNTSLAFAAPGGYVKSRFSAIWKVQNTGAVGIVTIAWPVGINNLHLVRSSDATINSSDEFISMTDVVSINGVNYNMATITFMDGDYFTFAELIYSPGGVPNAPSLWYRADVASTLTLSGSNVNQWKNSVNPTAANQTLGATTYNSYGTGSFSSGDRSTNFFPIVNFIGNNGMHTPVGQDPLGLAAGTHYAMFLGSRMEQQTTAGGNAMVFFTNPTNNDIRPGLGNRLVSGVSVAEHRQFGTCGLDLNNSNKDLSTLYTSVISGAKNNSLTYTSNSGSEISASNTYNCVIERQLRMGRATNNANNNWGGVQEFIMFTGTTLTATQRRQVETYLALRQGVTLINHYYNTSGSIVWNRTGHSYNNRIFGVARDGATDVKVSNSVEQLSTDNPNRLIVATSKDFTSLQNNATRTSFTNNGSYVIFGDNGLSGQSAGNDPCTGLPVNGLVENNRYWRVQSTGNPDAIWLNINLSHTNIIGQVKMVVATNSLFTDNVQVISAVGYTSKIATFNYKFSAGTRYIKFIGSSLAAECLGCSYAGSQTLNFTSTSWPSGTISKSFNLGALIVNASISLPSPAQWYSSKFPQASTGNSLKLRRKTSGITVMKSQFDLNIASAANFEIYDLDNYYKRYDNVQVYGLCNGAIVYPNLSYKIAATKSSYTLSNSNASAKGKSSSLYNYDKGKMIVSFDKAVETIIINQVVEGVNVGKDQQLGIGPITFSCPNPVPSNPDGVTIQKSAPSSVPLCLAVPYKFRIKNDNCNSRTISLNDILPNNMLYVDNSLTFSDSALNTSAIVSNYADLNTLNVLFDIKGGATVDINIQAKFTPAATAGNYSNQATITYVGASGSDVTYSSCNMNTTGCSPTVVNAIPASPSPLPKVRVSHTGDAPGSCGALGTTYTVTIDNTSSGLATGLEFEVKLADGQVVNSGISFSSGITGVVDPSPLTGNSLFTISGLNLNSLSTNHTFTFSVTNNTINLTPYSSFVLGDDPANPCSASNFIEVVYPGKSCTTCENGAQTLQSSTAWYNGGATAKTSNALTNIALEGYVPSTGSLKADVTVTYPSNVEYMPTSFPRRYGTWVQLSRRDNQNGNLGKVTYKVNLKDSLGNGIAGSPSFQVRGISSQRGAKEKVIIKGICDTGEVMPIITSAGGTATQRRNSISGNVVTGIKTYYDNSSWSTVNVNFEKAVSELIIEWTVDRTTTTRNLNFLYIGDMTFVCDAQSEYNPDNINLYASFVKDVIPNCEEATIKLKIENNNCTSKTINITNTLPAGLEYVADRYVGIGTETPSYSGTNFSLSNLVVPSGNSYIYVNVKTPNNVDQTYSTYYSYSVQGGGSGYRSDDYSGQAGFQDAVVNYTRSRVVEKPIITKTVSSCYSSTNQLLTYTITIQNTSSSSIQDIEFEDFLDAAQTFVPSSLTFINFANNGTTTLEPDPNNGNRINTILISRMEIGGYDTAIITFQANVNFSEMIGTDTIVDTTGTYFTNIASLIIDPESECGASSFVSSLVHILECTETYCVKDGSTAASTIIGKVGITTQSKQPGWPGNVANGALVLESSNKGFVITRLTKVERDAIIGANLVEGMLIYVIDANGVGNGCFQLYNGTSWKCIERSCNN